MDGKKSLIEGSVNHYFNLLDDYFTSVNLEANFGIDNSAWLKFQKMRSLNITDFLSRVFRHFINHHQNILRKLYSFIR